METRNFLGVVSVGQAGEGGGGRGGGGKPWKTDIPTGSKAAPVSLSSAVFHQTVAIY